MRMVAVSSVKTLEPRRDNMSTIVMAALPVQSLIILNCFLYGMYSYDDQVYIFSWEKKFLTRFGVLFGVKPYN